MEDGYEFFADRGLVTVFSAPNYCGEFDNCGAMMSVDENLMCSFQVSPRLLCMPLTDPIAREWLLQTRPVSLPLYAPPWHRSHAHSACWRRRF